MALTRDFNQTIEARTQRDPGFAKVLLDEAAALFLSGEPATARLILRGVIDATVDDNLNRPPFTPGSRS